MLTQERLKELLHYDPETGIFTWIKFSASHRIKVGQVAGTPDNKGYLRIQIDNKSYRCSRIAWMYVYGEWPNHQIDHINRKNTDNRICNLRDVTSLENNLNSRRVNVERLLNNYQKQAYNLVHKQEVAWG